MRDFGPWPMAGILETLPATGALDRRYHVEPLLADLMQLRTREWLRPRVSTGTGVSQTIDLEWRSLPLRSIGGDPDRTDPGGPSETGFADTCWRQQAPSLDALLRTLPAPLRAVRLMALSPGAESPVHNDTKCGLPWGTVRLHVPLVTNPGAVLELGGIEHRWQPGQLWYADFTREHRVRNTGDAVRIHLVVDCHVTPALLRLFPPEFSTRDVLANTLLHAEPADSGDAVSGDYRVAVPASFLSFEEFGGEFLTDGDLTATRIQVDGDLGCLSTSGRTIGLRRMSGGEYRFSGWTSERSLELRSRSGIGPEVVLRTRSGDAVFVRGLPAKGAV